MIYLLAHRFEIQDRQLLFAIIYKNITILYFKFIYMNY